MASILIVEDIWALRDCLVTALRRAGYDVRTASTGLDAVAEIEVRHPHLVLLDLGLPDLSGWYVVDYLQGISGRQVPKIIVMTGDATATDHAKARHVDAILDKPFELDELLAVVRQASAS